MTYAIIVFGGGRDHARLAQHADLSKPAQPDGSEAEPFDECLDRLRPSTRAQWGPLIFQDLFKFANRSGTE